MASQMSTRRDPEEDHLTVVDHTPQTGDVESETVSDQRFAVVPVSVLYADVSDGAKVLWAVISRYGGSPFPGIKRLAEQMKVAERTVQNRLAELEKAGLLYRVKRYRVNGSETTNLYDLNPAWELSITPGATSFTPPGATSFTPITRASNNENPPTPHNYSEDFLSFWAAYPPKSTSSKKATYRKWCARVNEGVDPATLIAAAKRYAAERDGENPRFTLMAETFLGPDERWLPYAERLSDEDQLGEPSFYDSWGNPVYQ